jgi:hypothetical protein
VSDGEQHRWHALHAAEVVALGVVGSLVLWVEEIPKLFVRRQTR